MGICIISSEEKGRLINYGLPPVCDQHHHCSPKQALKKIESELFELVTDEKTGQQYIHQPPMHFLAVKKSGGRDGIGIVQRVVMAQPKHIEQIVFGEDNGAKHKHMRPRGISVQRIIEREPSFRVAQALERGTAIQSNKEREEAIQHGEES